MATIAQLGAGGVMQEASAGAGVAQGQSVPALGYVRQHQTWSMPQREKPTATLDPTATNVTSIVIDMAESGLPCDAAVTGTTDGLTEVHLAGCGRIVTLHAGASLARKGDTDGSQL